MLTDNATNLIIIIDRYNGISKKNAISHLFPVPISFDLNISIQDQILYWQYDANKNKHSNIQRTLTNGEIVTFSYKLSYVEETESAFSELEQKHFAVMRKNEYGEEYYYLTSGAKLILRNIKNQIMNRQDSKLNQYQLL